MLKEIIKTVLKPHEYVENIFAIDWSALKSQGIQALLFDLDNTILPTGEWQPSIRVINLFNDLKVNGFQLALISNDLKNKRVKKISESLGVNGYYFIFKPFTHVLSEIIKKDLRLNPSQVALIGDQLFTDILVGNWLEAYTILIKNCESTLQTKAPVGILKQAHSLIMDKFINK